MSANETIAAIATPPGRGSVGIIRLSGEKSLEIARTLTIPSQQIPTEFKTFKPRYAHYVKFYHVSDSVIDSGLAIYFPGPNSFTGEDVVELQGHGGPVILQMLLDRVLELGAVVAKPGEFSERAFLNEKIDLTQAEAIADLIDSSSSAAALSAMRSLQGEFSKATYVLLEKLIALRMYVESAIDFPEEEIDFLSDGIVLKKVEQLQQAFHVIKQQAGVGRLLQSGFKLALAGRPNAGKSSLLNVLSGTDAAIVTDVEGTTRDSITVTVNFDGLPIHITDTAGLRDSQDKIEQIGIERTRRVISEVDHVLLLVDANRQQDLVEILSKEQLNKLEKSVLTVVYNKTDLVSVLPSHADGYPFLCISVETQEGLTDLKKKIKNIAGYQSEDNNVFSARARHINALQEAENHVAIGKTQLLEKSAGELLAEELHQAQYLLNTITGEFTNDDLLGEIFSSFCIGK